MRNIFIAAFLFVGLLLPASLFAQANAPVGINIGNRAPQIAETGIDGEIIKLSDLKGKLVLIDFWASWCGPCRVENPKLSAAYEKYKNEKFSNGNGFAIFSVSLDNDKNRWISTIESDKLNWPWHVSDLNYWKSKYAVVYKVNSLPSSFLINGDGIIIAKNLRGPMIEKTLEDLKIK